MSKEQTIKNLQTALEMEMTAAHQYQLHAQVLDDWGLNLLAAKMREEMQEEIAHSDLFMERIIFLGGTPQLRFQKQPARAETLKQMFEMDAADEQEAVEVYSRGARDAFEAADIGSRTLFERIALDEEGHKSWLDLQLSLLERLGERAFSAKWISMGADEADDAEA